MATPKEAASREAGWMSFDLRDTERSGEPSEGASQPNLYRYDQFFVRILRARVCFCWGNPATNLELQFDQPSFGTPTRARLVYDIRSFGETGAAILSVNGQLVGMLPPPESAVAAVFAERVHRSIDVDPSLLHRARTT